MTNEEQQGVGRLLKGNNQQSTNTKPLSYFFENFPQIKRRRRRAIVEIFLHVFKALRIYFYQTKKGFIVWRINLISQKGVHT